MKKLMVRLHLVHDFDMCRCTCDVVVKRFVPVYRGSLICLSQDSVVFLYCVLLLITRSRHCIYSAASDVDKRKQRKRKMMEINNMKENF